jgi:hypothetical protein
VGFWHTFAMTRIAAAEFRCLFGARGVSFLLCVVGLSGLWVGARLLAQDVAKAADEPVQTLHVYANLIQIPTLVLGPNREPIKAPIADSKFSIRIDNGPWFPATHARLEAEDPISLSVLLDVSGDTTELMPKIGAAIAGLAPSSLHSKDHISIYALDCSLIQSLSDAPAERGALKSGVDEALRSWTSRKHGEHEPNCQQSVHLWDALDRVTGEMSKLPGRRVILAVTNGQDRGSSLTWNEARSRAENRGVAVFGLTYIPDYARDANTMLLLWDSEQPFHQLCELSGGMVFLTKTAWFSENLKHFVMTVRGRYIVEFPRPANAAPGEHVKEIKIAGTTNAFIRPAGISVPIQDPAVLADPTTVPSDPTRTPELGTRAPMKKPY